MCRHFDIPDDNMDALIATLRRICDFLHTAIRNGGRVLVYCSSEFRASAIVCAYRAFPGTLSFMDGELTPDYLQSCSPSASLPKLPQISSPQVRLDRSIADNATTLINHPVLPFFEPSPSFRNHLQFFESCQCNPRPRSASIRGMNSVTFSSPAEKDTPSPLANTLKPVTTGMA